MKQSLILFMIIAVAAGSVAIIGTSAPASAGVGVNLVTPTPTTTTTGTTATTTSSTSTSTTTSTSFITSQTTTSTTTTSTYTSFSYTSSMSVTSTNSSTSTSLTGTQTITKTTTTSSTSLATSSTTSTAIFPITTTIAKFPGCLIATATFGSELAPEVQLLRGFRDDSILKTAAGSGFMVAFNSWYYSFSPSVAGYLATHAVERTIMKGVLYPLIGILKLSSLTFSATGAFPELAALLSGLVASSLIGAFYLGLPLSLIRARIRRLQGRRMQMILEKALSAALLGGLVTLVAGELVPSTIVLMLASATVVLSALFLSATFTSARISKKLQAK